jgi:SNF2 family DNA or RNA helicase
VEVQEIAQEPEIESLGTRIAMADFLDQFGEGLLEQVRSQNPPVYAGAVEAQSPIHKARAAVMDGLKRKPFHAQAEAVQAVCKLLLDHGEPAAVINAEMGTGKTMMAICVAAVMQEQLPRTLVISPPHLVYKWRREIMDTVPNAKVWVLNGQDTLRKLLAVRMALQRRGVKSELIEPSRPEFFILGRVRMRMGFHWKPSYNVKRVLESVNDGQDTQVFSYASCPDCGAVVTQPDSDGGDHPISLELANVVLSDNRCKCSHCGSQLWTLIRKGTAAKSMTDLVMDALKQMPTIGEKTAQKLLKTFGEELISSMLGDNVYEFLNLMDENGDLVFNDRQAARMERRLATFEFSIGEGGYQPTEFIKRYLPKHYFGLLVVDEGHEYKNEGSAQGQAMGVLASQCRKVVLLTGTLMGGYADDLFHLLWRMNPAQMVADGFKASKSGSMSGATMNFMREHGVLKDIYKETAKSAHRTCQR